MAGGLTFRSSHLTWLPISAGTCKNVLTGDSSTRDRRWVLTSEELLAELAALGHQQRLRIIAELAGGRVHVSELARRLGLSRPLLYLHLEKLETAGLITGELELSADGKAMKYFDLAPFEVRVTAETIVEALRTDERTDSHEAKGNQK